MAAVAPPIDSTDPKVAVPTMRKRCTGPSADTPTVSPTPSSCSFADAASIVTSRAASGKRPELSWKGLIRAAPGVCVSIPAANVGSPP